jgi:hypothetical protein
MFYKETSWEKSMRKEDLNELSPNSTLWNDLTCEEMHNKGIGMEIYASKEDLDEAHFEKWLYKNILVRVDLGLVRIHN